LPFMTHSPVLLWFRCDLRLADQPALQAALATGRPIIPIYIIDELTPGAWAPGGAQRWWLHHALAALDADLRACGSALVLRRGSFAVEVPRLMAETGADEVHAGFAVEPWARRVMDGLATRIPLRRHMTSLMFHPEEIRTAAGTPFGVFTPFSRACLARYAPYPSAPAPVRLPAASLPRSERLEDWALLPTSPDWAGGLRAAHNPGEAGAHRRLAEFLPRVSAYGEMRDRPDIDATSMLSPHLAFGGIAPWRMWEAAASLAEGRGLEKFRAEILWREFSAHLLWHAPSLPETPLKPAYAAFPWQPDAAALAAWQRGRTGIPMVDAGMRQLWQTGWMHNRVRMITASFLIKHLLQPWQDGEAWFWDTLVDADLAANSASWQWVAGSGADAAPFFRIFNPVLQGQKFDPDGLYVRRFVPELAHVPAKFIHAPWEMEKPPRNYPAPIIDLAFGRQRALDALQTITKSAP
jgi:deoxyribodipyrimidine photo-lyase